jgi:hypothetical protein
MPLVGTVLLVAYGFLVPRMFLAVYVPPVQGVIHRLVLQWLVALRAVVGRLGIGGHLDDLVGVLLAALLPLVRAVIAIGIVHVPFLSGGHARHLLARRRAAAAHLGAGHHLWFPFRSLNGRRPHIVGQGQDQPVSCARPGYRRLL